MTAIDSARLQRAIYLDCRRVAPDRWLVTGGAAGHVLVVDGGYIRCDCPDYAIRGDG